MAQRRYTVKLSRLITHRKTLPQRVDEFIENYMHRIACFEAGKVAQLLVQFPPYLERDDAHLGAFLDKLSNHHRYVVEFRHQSWLAPEVLEMLLQRNIAFCIHDYLVSGQETWSQAPTSRTCGFTVTKACTWGAIPVVLWALGLSVFAS